MVNETKNNVSSYQKYDFQNVLEIVTPLRYVAIYWPSGDEKYQSDPTGWKSWQFWPNKDGNLDKSDPNRDGNFVKKWECFFPNIPTLPTYWNTRVPQRE